MPNNVQGLINDPAFVTLNPSDQRKALSGVSGDVSFSNLSDADTYRFVSSLRRPPQNLIPNPQQRAQQRVASIITGGAESRNQDEEAKAQSMLQAAGGLKAAPLGPPASAGLGAVSGAAAFQKLLEDKAAGVPTLQALKNAGIAGVGTFAGGKILDQLSSLIAPTADEVIQKVNNILGVSVKEVRPGKVPQELQGFATQPGRGVLNADIYPDQLAKMNPLQRNQAVMAARDTAGKQIDAALSHAPGTVNVQAQIDNVLNQLPVGLKRQAQARVTQAVANSGVTGSLDNLPLLDARQVQRSMDEIANFKLGNPAISYRDVATQIRTGISKEIRTSYPEVAPLDQHYSDLANAASATQRQVKQFASHVVPSKSANIVKKVIPYLVGGGIAGAAVRELSK